VAELLLLIGDQIYVDEDAPETRAFIRSRRETSRPPGEEVLDFEEYTHCIGSRERPVIRCSSRRRLMMIFDDHDSTTTGTRRSLDRGDAVDGLVATRIESALGSYWVYQHLGNSRRRSWPRATC